MAKKLKLNVEEAKDLYAKTIRRNKIARQKFAVKNGFKTAADMVSYLRDIINGVVKSKKKSKKKSKEGNLPLDMVIAFDTTGSMSSYIHSVKREVRRMIPELFKNNTNFLLKIVAFGDYCDMKSPNNFGKAYQESKLSNDEQHLIEFVQGAENTGGGDSDEFYELVIKKITEETLWRKDSRKSVLLIADANPHRVGYSYSNKVRNSQIDWRVEAQKSADAGIEWDSFQINTYSSRWLKELAQITGGVSLPFKSSGKTTQVIENLSYGRSGATTAFMANVATATADGDTELLGTYKSMGTL